MPTLPAFMPAAGGEQHKIVPCRLQASQTIRTGAVLKFSSGADTVLEAASGNTFCGVLVGKGKASTDSDYASITDSTMILIGENVWFDAPLTGSTSSLKRGTTCDLSSAILIAAATDSNHDFLCQKLINNSTAVRGSFKIRVAE